MLDLERKDGIHRLTRVCLVGYLESTPEDRFHPRENGEEEEEEELGIGTGEGDHRSDGSTAVGVITERPGVRPAVRGVVEDGVFPKERNDAIAYGVVVGVDGFPELQGVHARMRPPLPPPAATAAGVGSRG